MINLLNEKYDRLKVYIKYNRDGRYNEELNDEIISIYASVLGYYSAKIDLNYSENNTESLEDKIMLQSYDKKLIQKLNLTDYIDNFIKPNAESKRAEFYDTILLLKENSNLDKGLIGNIKDSYDNGYLVTVLNKKQNKLNAHIKKKIYKNHEKSYKMIKNAHLD